MIRSHVPDASIVIFSGFEQEAMAQQALVAGADRYLEKGAAVGDIVACLRELRGRSVGGR
jgi:ActR/RegA family two-component response regulator